MHHVSLLNFLVMASGGGDQRLAACSEGERDSWIEVLHMASYSYIRVTTFYQKKQSNHVKNFVLFRHKLHLYKYN